MVTIRCCALLGILLLTFWSCRERGAGPVLRLQPSLSFETSQCVHTSLGKGSLVDSVFVYSFTDSLVLDFSVVANCCPDSNRFAVIQIPNGDTLVVAVADTAGNLCHCVCLYFIHASIANLQADHYVVLCRIVDSDGTWYTIHLANVYRAILKRQGRRGES